MSGGASHESSIARIELLNDEPDSTDGDDNYAMQVE
jgi:hypothetical protein